jgi:hypothetical protein
MSQLQSSETSNRRIIGQLNSQVDFLNEQLAMREAQLVETADKILRAESVHMEILSKTRQLDQVKNENVSLITQLKVCIYI